MDRIYKDFLQDGQDMKLSELAERTGARVEGAADDLEITGAAGLDEATKDTSRFSRIRVTRHELIARVPRRSISVKMHRQIGRSRYCA
jgi:hypothetical protein